MKKRTTLPLLGGLSAEQFLHTYWQKKPLLIRGAFANFVAPFTRAEALSLATREDAEARLIVRTANRWQVTHSPFTSRDLRAATKSLWTILIQDTQHHSHEAHDLLAQFNFIPNARIDDLMVSVAAKGAGVGPHVDSYDVFLLQGEGRRRWQISTQSDQTLQANQPLKLLKNFKPQEEWVLAAGDMLYLPPHVAHNGIAESECMTWSIGFRAPSQQELATGFLDFLRDDLVLDGPYRDADLCATTRPGEIDAAMLTRLRAMLKPLHMASRERHRIHHFLGRFLTEPKPHVQFAAPSAPLPTKAFLLAARRRGVALDLCTRLLYQRGEIFVNGDALAVTPPAVPLLQALADRRKLAPSTIAATHLAPLYSMYCAGYLHLGAEV